MSEPTMTIVRPKDAISTDHLASDNELLPRLDAASGSLISKLVNGLKTIDFFLYGPHVAAMLLRDYRPELYRDTPPILCLRDMSELVLYDRMANTIKNAKEIMDDGLEVVYCMQKSRSSYPLVRLCQGGQALLELHMLPAMSPMDVVSRTPHFHQRAGIQYDQEERCWVPFQSPCFMQYLKRGVEEVDKRCSVSELSTLNRRKITLRMDVQLLSALHESPMEDDEVEWIQMPSWEADTRGEDKLEPLSVRLADRGNQMETSMRVHLRDGTVLKPSKIDTTHSGQILRLSDMEDATHSGQILRLSDKEDSREEKAVLRLDCVGEWAYLVTGDGRHARVVQYARELTDPDDLEALRELLVDFELVHTVTMEDWVPCIQWKLVGEQETYLLERVQVEHLIRHAARY